MSNSLCIAIAARGKVDLIPCLQPLVSNPRPDRLPISIHICHDLDLDMERINSLVASQSEHNSPLSITTHRCLQPCSILQMWGTALAETNATYAAVLDAHCPPAKNWLTTVAEQINRGTLIFYGSVEPGWPLSDRNTIGYLVEYAQFMHPLNCKSEYPGNNIVFQTHLLETADSLREKGFLKTFMLWKLEQQQGNMPEYCQHMAVSYHKSFSFKPYLGRRRDHGRCFAATRLQQEQQPPRWLCIAFTPLLFLLRTLRIYRWTRNKPVLLLPFLRFLPGILCSELAWSYGEFLGYCFGDNGCCQQLD